MQITTLNKIINLFLVGIFANTLFAVVVIYNAKDYISQNAIADLKTFIDSIGNSTVVLLITFIFLSTSILFGIVTDALSDFFFHRVLKKIIKNELVRKILYCNGNYEQHELLAKVFREMFSSSSKYKNLVKCNDESENKKISKAYASALFFHTANKENIEWAVQHYSFYLLSMNYLLISCGCLILSLFMPITVWNRILLTGTLLVFIYGLLYQAVHKYLYTYEVTFRHCAVILGSDVELKKQKAFMNSP